jgi:hypothetical protein
LGRGGEGRDGGEWEEKPPFFVFGSLESTQQNFFKTELVVVFPRDLLVLSFKNDFPFYFF